MTIENRYSEDKAFEEASKMKEEIDSGKAESYNEAENLVDKEKIEEEEKIELKEEEFNTSNRDEANWFCSEALAHKLTVVSLDPNHWPGPFFTYLVRGPRKDLEDFKRIYQDYHLDKQKNRL